MNIGILTTAKESKQYKTVKKTELLRECTERTCGWVSISVIIVSWLCDASIWYYSNGLTLCQGYESNTQFVDSISILNLYQFPVWWIIVDCNFVYCVHKNQDCGGKTFFDPNSNEIE